MVFVRLGESEVDALVAVVSVVGEVHVDGERVVIGIRASGKALRHSSAAGQKTRNQRQAGFVSYHTLEKLKMPTEVTKGSAQNTARFCD